MLVATVGGTLDSELLLEAALGLKQSLRPRAGDRRGLLGKATIEILAGAAQPNLAAQALADRVGQRQLRVDIVVGLIARDRFVDDRAGDLLIAQGAVAVGVGRHLRAVDRDHPDRRQAGIGAQREDLAEQITEGVLVALDEPRDRGVIGTLLCGDDAAGDILDAGALDRP